MDSKSPAQVYEDFFVPAMFVPCCERLLAALPLQPGERVLDLACGSGVVAIRAAKLVGAGGSVLGVDLRPGMIAVAQGLPVPSDAHVEFQVGDAHELVLADGSFDVVLCQQGLQFFAERVKATREIRRVLRDGGRFAAAVWRGLDDNDFFRALTEAESQHLDVLGVNYEDIAAPFLFGDADALSATLRDGGLREVSVEPTRIEARFPATDFIENVEFAYSAMVPAFSEDPAKFRAFVDAVEEGMRDVLARHRQADHIVFDIHLNIAVAVA